MTGRLSRALERGIFSLSEGDTLVLGATQDSDLQGLNPARTRVLWRYHTVHMALSAAGWTTVKKTGGPAENVIVFLPQARDAQRAYLRLAREMTNGAILVDGPKTHGVDAIYRELRDRADVSEAWSKAHGKTFSVSGGDFTDWPSIHPAQDPDGWWRAPGVFSADGIDKASALLAETLPPLSGSIIDLGAGWGFLSKSILKSSSVTDLTLVENDETALGAAFRNIEDQRAKFLNVDALSWQPPDKVDHVVTNPPFHAGRKAEPKLGQAFIQAAARMLKPKGELWLVANRHLPYESTLNDAFRTVTLPAETASFKIFHATSPKRRKA